jgi:hypothetical protein
MYNAVKPKWYTVFAISSNYIEWGSWSKCAPVTLVVHPVMGFGGDDDVVLWLITSGSCLNNLLSGSCFRNVVTELAACMEIICGKIIHCSVFFCVQCSLFLKSVFLLTCVCLSDTGRAVQCWNA